MVLETMQVSYRDQNLICNNVNDYGRSGIDI